MIIRHLLLLWTGDHPAQCEVCKSKSSGGKKGCRRCRLEGDYFWVSHIQQFNNCHLHNNSTRMI